MRSKVNLNQFICFWFKQNDACLHPSFVMTEDTGLELLHVSIHHFIRS